MSVSGTNWPEKSVAIPINNSCKAQTRVVQKATQARAAFNRKLIKNPKITAGSTSTKPCQVTPVKSGWNKNHKTAQTGSKMG